MEELDLRVSGRTDAAASLRELLGELQRCDDKAVLSEKQAHTLSKQVDLLRETLEAELSGIDVYSVSPKRFDNTLLIQNPAGLLAPGVFQRLPEIARYDFTEGARCIAYELPTAAAFHLMRSTESVLRAFYAALVPGSAKAQMWGDIITDLRKARVGEDHAALLNHLDHIRLSFRNPTQHPEARYDIHEIQDLMGVCIDAINRMGRVLGRA
jgi:hypothetical protein